MSKEIKIFRNTAKTRNLLLSSGAVSLVLGIVFIYGLGLFDDIFKAKVAVASGAVFLIMLILVIKSLINLKDKSAIFELNENTASGKTSLFIKSYRNH